MAQHMKGGPATPQVSEDILRTLLGMSQDVLYAVALPAVSMLYATPSFAARLGLPQDFLSQGFAFDQYLPHVHPDDRARVVEIMGAIVRSRTDAELPENPACYRLGVPGGPCMHIQDHYRVLRNPDGSPYMIMGNSRDATGEEQARLELSKKEQHFRILTENSPDLFFSIRFPEVTFDYVSPSYEALTGYSPQQHYDDPHGVMFSVIAPHWREQVAAWIEEIRQGRVQDTYEYQILGRDGDLRWLLQRQVLAPAPDGRGMLLQGVGTDVTELRTIRLALDESEGRFRALAENSRDIFFSLRYPEGRYEYISPCVAEIFGVSPQDFYADNATMLRCLAPEWRATVQGWLAEIAQGRVLPQYDFEVIDRHGRRRWMTQRQVYVPAPDGRGMLLQGVAADVTEERETQRELREKEERFRQLIEAWPDQVMLSVNLDAGRHEYVSPSMERVMGYAPQEFYADPGLGMRVVAPQWQERAWGWIAEIRAGVVQPFYEFELVHKNGQHRWIHQVGVLQPRAPGQDLVVQFTFRDITEERQGRQALVDSEARFRELAESWTEQVLLRVNLHTMRYEYVSPSMEKVFGYAPEEFYQESPRALGAVAPEWRGAVLGWLEENKRGTVRPEYEYEIIDAWGKRRWLHQRSALLDGADGPHSILQAVVLDATERHQLEEEVQSARVFLDCIIEQSPIAMWLSDENGVMIRTNKALRVGLGFRDEEALGHYNIFHDPQLVEQGVMPQLRQVFQQGGTARFTLNFNTGAVPGVAPERAVQAVIDVTISAVQDARGRTTNLIVQHVDVTGRMRLERELADSERMYRTLHESMREGFAAVDEDGRIVEHNKAFRDMLGYEAHEIRQLTYWDITPEAWHEAEGAIVQDQVRVRGYSEVYEKEYRRKDGSVFPVALRTYKVQESLGPGICYWAIVRDVSEQKRAEQDLARKDALLRAMLRNLPFDFWARDNDDRVVMQSDESVRLWGDLTTDPARELCCRESTLEAWREVRNRVRASGAISEERELAMAGGEVRAYHSIVAPIRDGEAVLGMLGINVDITQRKRVEEALRLSNERYTLLTDNIVDVIWSTDEQLRWTYLTPSAEALSGFPMEKLLTMRFDELFTPASMRTVMEAMAQRQRERAQGQLFQAHGLQLEIMRADGTLLPLEVLVRPLYGPGEAILGYCGTSRDISQRRQAEEALRKSEARYALALRGASDGIWDWDLVNDVVYYSDRWKEILGYGPDELRHDPEEWTTRIHPEDNDRVMTENQRCIRGDTPIFQVEYRLLHKDGTYRWVFGRGAALVDESGRVVRMAGAHTDITERKQAEEALSRSERLFRKLLASMHEGVWAVDADRRTTFVNERLCAMLGYSAEELAEMTPLGVLEGQGRVLFEEKFQERLWGMSATTDYELCRKDGTRFSAQVMSSPLMDEEGRFEGIVSGVVDLTERVRLEDELRRGQARSEALLELSRHTGATERQIAAFALRQALGLTDSQGGVLFFLSPDGEHLLPMAWEGGSNEQGAGPSAPPGAFPARTDSPWGRVLATGAPLALNDFGAGPWSAPVGHLEVMRFLGVPALSGKGVQAVLGLTNKAQPYTEDDALQLSLLMDGMWRVVRGRRDEERIRASLREKEVLLREVHHRVKNNLQVISSLLDMSGRRLVAAESRLALAEVQSKVQAMSLIHAQLYGARDARGIRLGDYVDALFHQLREVYAGGLNLSARFHLGGLVLGLDQAVPLGLALNEALANVFKHAARPQTPGHRGSVEMRAVQDQDGVVTLTVRDNGPGLPPGLDPESSKGLGMRLMRGIVRRQLAGELGIANHPEGGVCVTLRFKPEGPLPEATGESLTEEDQPELV